MWGKIPNKCVAKVLQSVLVSSRRQQEECSTGNKKHKKFRLAGPNQKGKFCDLKLACGGQRLALSSFGGNSSKPDGLKTYCKACESQYRQTRKHKEIEYSRRTEITTKRYCGLKGGRRGWDTRLEHFEKTGEYLPYGYDAAKNRLDKDLEGSGRVRKYRRWRPLNDG